MSVTTSESIIDWHNYPWPRHYYRKHCYDPEPVVTQRALCDHNAPPLYNDICLIIHVWLYGSFEHFAWLAQFPSSKDAVDDESVSFLCSSASLSSTSRHRTLIDLLVFSFWEVSLIVCFALICPQFILPVSSDSSAHCYHLQMYHYHSVIVWSLWQMCNL